MKAILIAIVAAGVPLCSARGLRAGIVYDATADFSPTNDPNGVWSYGTSLTLGGSLSLFSIHRTDSNIDFWIDSMDEVSAWVAHNPTALTQTFFTAVFGPGQLAFHPGPNNEVSIVRFTAPNAGAYEIDSDFFGIDPRPTQTEVHVFVNGTSIFDGLVDGYGPGSGPSYAKLVQLSAGDTIDFAVNFGAAQDWPYDSTGLRAKVTFMSSVPEPGSIALFGLGTISLAFGKWRSKVELARSFTRCRSRQARSTVQTVLMRA